MNAHKKRRLYSNDKRSIVIMGRRRCVNRVTWNIYNGQGLPPHVVINHNNGKPKPEPRKKVYYIEPISPVIEAITFWQNKRYITGEEEDRLKAMYKSIDPEMKELFKIIYEEKEKGFKKWMKKKKSKRHVPQYQWLTTTIG